eukprot:TRINITY_DN14354_c0_g2_i2.p1 TRINITY_DN14354_c0_g2~~TRINITY_DN14354_c0_g2_i2.p1  ORF type:complete len:182 (+),score=27.64 TRINITY_DN14354_c0_g2_i2:338-883(+)
MNLLSPNQVPPLKATKTHSPCWREGREKGDGTRRSTANFWKVHLCPNIAIGLYGKRWKKIEDHIGTRTRVQIRSHAQKHFLKSKRMKSLIKSSKAPRTKEQSKEIPKKSPLQPDKVCEGKARVEVLRECVNSVMAQVSMAAELSAAKERMQLLDMLKKRCLEINGELENIMPYIIFGIIHV